MRKADAKVHELLWLLFLIRVEKIKNNVCLKLVTFKAFLIDACFHVLTLINILFI